MTRLVWLFLFINVYWWGHSGQVPIPSMDIVASNTPVVTGFDLIFQGVLISILTFSLSYVYYTSSIVTQVNTFYLKIVVYCFLVWLAYYSFIQQIFMVTLFCIVVFIYTFYFYLGLSRSSHKDSLAFDKVKHFFYSNRVGFIIIGIFISFFGGFYIFALYLSALLILSTFKDSLTQKFSFLQNLKNSLAANETVRNYHKKDEFPLLYHFLSILTWTLICAFFISIVLVQNSLVSQETFISFRQDWLAFLFFFLTLQFLYEIYIIIFCNMPIPKPILEACSACVKWGGGTLLALGAGEVTGILEPTEPSLNFRRAAGLDVYQTNALKDRHKALLNHLKLQKEDVFTEKVHFSKPKTLYSTERRDFILGTGASSNRYYNFRDPQSFGLTKDFKFRNTYWEIDPTKIDRVIQNNEALLRAKGSLRDKKILFPADFDTMPAVHTEHGVNVDVRPALPNANPKR